MIISHDRWFLDPVATHMLAFEGDRKRRHGIDAETPDRINYKPFARA
jgi:ATPase subunit of ABC transporter with duplicated ATPase domains